MSDLDDEILELAGAGEKKRKRAQSSKSNKRRREDLMGSSDSEQAAPEQEEPEADPYPLEGKYMDEYDRQQLLEMSEIEREQILSQRLEEKQNRLDKRNLHQMIQIQQRGGNSDERVANAAKRQHTARGATKEKTNKLAELKAKRKAKDERKRNTSPRRDRDRSSSPMDMEISDGESEDGQITRFEQEEEKVGKIFNNKPSSDFVEPITIVDLENCRLTRDRLAKHALAPWFEDYVKGAYVRYLIGNEQGDPVYRICEIQNLSADFVKPYKINDKLVDQSLELKHGKAVRTWPMDKVSNGSFTSKEYEFWTATCTKDEVRLPTKLELHRKLGQLERLPKQPVTESDINAMLERKKHLQQQQGRTPGMTTMERSRLNAARTLALRRGDMEEVAQIDDQMATLGPVKAKAEEAVDLLAKVNERNRKANMEAVRKAEIAESERKRRDRKLAAAGTPVVHDPSARLKTMPRMFNNATPTTSRPGTPGTTTPQPSHTSQLPPSALSGKPNGAEKTFEASVIDAVEVDLGDF